MASTVLTTRFDTSTNKDLLKEGTLRNIFDNTIREGKKNIYYPTLVKEESTTIETLRDQRMAGLGLASQVVEGQNIPLQSPIDGGQKEYSQLSWGTSFRMTHKFDRFNKYNLWKRWAGQLAQVQNEAKDIEIHTMFNSLTSTSGLNSGAGFDSYAIAYDTHTGLDPATTSDNYDNYLDAAMSVTSVQSGRYYFTTLKDDRGLLMGAKATHLVFEPTLFFTAKEIVGSDLKPHEFSNTINIIPDMGLQLYEDPRLTSPTCWFLISKTDKYDFHVFTGMEPIFITRDAPDNTLDRVAITLQYFIYGWGDARLLYTGNT